MIRLISLIALLLVALPAPRVSAQGVPTLKPAVSVASNLVTLGDLIANAGAKADIAVFRAPDLGRTGTVSAEEILNAALMHGLSRIETGGLAGVSVTRASRVVSAEEMHNALIAALAVQTSSEDPEAISIELDAASTNIQLPVAADGALSIADAVWQQERGTFTAVLVAGRSDGREERRAISGRAFETVPVVVARRGLSRGTVLTPDDLMVERQPKAEARSNSLGGIDLAVGMELRRMLREGQALRTADLSEPTLVESGAAVTIVLKTGGLTLTATAQALNDGKRGSSIQVMNLQSKRVLQAVVTGPNQVSVHPPRTIISAAK